MCSNPGPHTALHCPSVLDAPHVLTGKVYTPVFLNTPDGGGPRATIGSVFQIRRRTLDAHTRQDSLRLPTWTLGYECDLAKLGGWVVGRNVSEGGWSDVVTVDR